MLPSESGVGKGFLFNDIISPLSSMQTKLVKSFSAITGRFGATVLEGSTWAMMDDCKAGSETAFADSKMGKPSNIASAELLTACGYQKDTLTKPSRGRWWFPKTMTSQEAEAILMAKSEEPAF